MLLIAAILSFLMYGVIAGMLGTVMPSFTAEFGLTGEQNGNIALAQALGLVIASLCAGPIIDLRGKKTALLGGLTRITAALGGIPSAAGYRWLTALYFILGLGTGIVVTGANALASRAGKQMPITCTEILVRVRRPPDIYHAGELASNHIRFRISPDVSIGMGMMAMSEGKKIAGEPAEMVAIHHPAVDEMDAYERVLGEAIEGDATLFAREDYVEEAWRIVDPVLRADTPVFEYEPGTWGPVEANQAIAPVGGWHAPVLNGAKPSKDVLRAA
jgi:hypothetical protein